MYSIQVRNDKYLIVSCSDPVTLALPRLKLNPCRDSEKAFMGFPIQQDKEVNLAGWRTNIAVPGFPGICVSLLRYYKGQKGEFLSCFSVAKRQNKSMLKSSTL